MTPPEAEELADRLEDLEAEIAKQVVGYEAVVRDLVAGMLVGGHVLIEGVPGVAKTTLAKAFARGLDLSFGRVQCTSDLLPADITGHYYYDRSRDRFEFRQGPIFHNLVLVDEINRAPPRVQTAFLEAMEEQQVTVEGETHALPDPFMVVATLNPGDSQVTYQLPIEQLDRFTIHTEMRYLPRERERDMLERKLDPEAEVAPVLSADFVQRARKTVATVEAGEQVVEYLHDIGLASREDERVALGASPRSLEDLLAVTRARALLEGRGYAIPSDVKKLAGRVLDHRIKLSMDAEMAGLTPEKVLREILTDLPVPK